MSTFLELYTELSDRGYAHLTTARLKALINRGRSRLDNMYCWPYTEDSAQGVAPLSIPTLRIIEAVSNETRGYLLEELGYTDALDLSSDLAEAGSAIYWYRSMPAGDPVVNTVPTSSSDIIGVQFWAVTPDLSADADEPLAPDRYHGLIVDLAQQMAERERGNFEASQSLQADVDRQVQEMVADLLSQQAPVHQRIAFNSEDW